MFRLRTLRNRHRNSATNTLHDPHFPKEPEGISTLCTPTEESSPSMYAITQDTPMPTHKNVPTAHTSKSPSQLGDKYTARPSLSQGTRRNFHTMHSYRRIITRTVCNNTRHTNADA